MPALWELDEFAPPAMLGFLRDLTDPAGVVGTKWLPDTTTNDLSFEYILGASHRPVMAHVMGFDSEAPIHGQAARGARVSGELPPIKRKSRIGEKTLARFLTPRAGTSDVQDAISQVYTNAADLADAVRARVEWLRIQALSEDVVRYDEAGTIFDFDFGINDLFQIDLTASGGPKNGAGDDESLEFSTSWTDLENSNPVEDLAALCNRVQAKTGRRPGEFVVGQKVGSLLSRNATLRGLVRGEGAATGILAQAEIQGLFDLYDLPTITVYDTVFQRENEDGSYSDVRPLAPGKAFLVPDNFGALNKTLWGPTAESRVLYGTALGQQAPGIWGETYPTTEPPAQWTKVAATSFPTIPEANLIAQMTIV